ncbi:hypothetical protein [Neoasaia chiangmaiensis]|uniref:Uncharacterized protein n=1 Tax=Neoasaia chiangmaiensis TaxID=320497 RepID=A0A1U9KQX3_9PROT|nr:hypothetical protein [Neoasaia chiangmaiensis]AQS88254.1 hypothetical protein A0U93_10235 [Neoasaia chiangmaiensis]
MARAKTYRPADFVPTQANVWARAADGYDRIARTDRLPGKRIWAQEEAQRCRRMAAREAKDIVA